MLNKLTSIYAKTKVCQNNTCLALEPELNKLFSSSRDYNELLHYWKSWHDLSGNNMKQIYAETIELLNKRARENGHKDLSGKWLEEFEDNEFERKFDNLYNEIKPFYQQLHAYVRRKLRENYGKHYPSTHNNSLIPAHLLGNMWAQNWENIYDLVAPYPNIKQTNLTQILLEKNFSAIKMFHVCFEFLI